MTSPTVSSAPQQPEPERVRGHFQCLNRFGPTPEEAADALGLKGYQRQNFLANTSSGKTPVDTARFLPAIEMTGVPDHRPFEAIHNFDASAGMHRAVLSGIGQVRFRVSPLALQKDSSLFPAHFRDLPAIYMPESYHPGANHVLLMQLPDRDRSELYRHLGPGPEIRTSNCFASLGIELSRTGDLAICSAESPYFDRITDPELKSRYGKWREQLLKAFYFFVHLRPTLRCATLVEKGNFVGIAPQEVKARIPCPELAEIRRMAQNLIDQGLLQGKLFTEVPPEKVAEMRKCLLDAGIARETVSWRTVTTDTALSREVFRALRVPLLPLSGERFLASDHPLRQLFETEPVPDIHAAFDNIDRVYPPDIFDLSLSRGYVPSHPTVPALWFGESLSAVRAHGEIAPALPLEVNALLLSLTPQELSAFTSGLDHPNARHALSLFGRYHALVSKARLTGGNPIFSIPPDQVGPYYALTHVADQNRHPYIRCVIPTTHGTSERFVIGFKGAGAKSLDGTRIIPPTDGTELPIHLNSAPDLKDEQDPGGSSPAPTPNLWGGEGFDTTELLQLVALRAFVEKSGRPELLALLPIPLDLRQYLALPTWKDGKTKWLGAAEYELKHLGSTYDDYRDVSTLMTVERCDIRLRQLVDRVFNRTPESAANLAVAGKEIADGLRSLFWWNGADTTLHQIDAITEGKTLSLYRLLQILARESQASPDRAQQVFQNSIGRLAELVGIVHGAGGHFGGGWRKVGGELPLGICYGGPMAMRNIDLCGGPHDFDISRMYFPWSDVQQFSPSAAATHRATLTESHAFDLLYLGEASYWFEVLLFGRSKPRLIAQGGFTVPLNQFNDIFLLDEATEQTLAIYQCVRDLQSGQVPADATVLLPRSIRARYQAGFGLGKDMTPPAR